MFIEVVERTSLFSCFIPLISMGYVRNCYTLFMGVTRLIRDIANAFKIMMLFEILHDTKRKNGWFINTSQEKK